MWGVGFGVRFVILGVRWRDLVVRWRCKVDKYRENSKFRGGVCEFESKMEGGVFGAFAN